MNSRKICSDALSARSAMPRLCRPSVSSRNGATNLKTISTGDARTNPRRSFWELTRKRMAEQKQVTFSLNGQQIVTPAGTLVIEAAKKRGVEVPSFCYYPGLSLQAACRMCLVEVEKAPKLQTACTLVAVNGMVVKTDTPQVHKARKDMIEFLLSNHPLDCPVCDKG